MQIQAFENRFELHPGISLSHQDTASYDFVLQQISTPRNQHAALPGRYLDEAAGIEILVIEGVKAKKPQIFD
jgi:hypothetical protein